MADRLGVVVLAAGFGTRMMSDTHKLLHPLVGLPLIQHVLRAAAPLPPDETVVVVGHAADRVRERIGSGVTFALQDPPRGTGDAVRAARTALEGRVGTVLVLLGDSPLVRTETLRRLVERHRRESPLVTLLTGRTHDPGRILRDERGRIIGIVEQKLATPEQLAIQERNTGVAAFRADWLWPSLERLPISAVGEYFLTDLIAMAAADGEVAGLELEDTREVMGVNDRAQLARAEAEMRRRILERLMLTGVTVQDPAATYVHADVEVGRDSVLLAGTHLEGATRIGAATTIGPGSRIVDSVVGDGCRVQLSVLAGAQLEDGVDVGPFSHLRPGTRIGKGVHLGNYVETKNTRIGARSACGHVSYLGDAEVGEDVNIGAGTITANYDGTSKHTTRIGDGAFVGVDTILRAPVTVGAGGRTGAGAVVTRDIPPGRLVVGVPARVVPEWGEADETREKGE